MATPKRPRSTSQALDAGHAAVVGDIKKRVRHVPSEDGSDDGSASSGSSSTHGATDSSNLQELVFRLQVIQQPQRARACGFGDKDHRPLSPIPIIQLRVYRRDGAEVPVDQVDTATLVLCLDLWSPDGTVERNVVRHLGSVSTQIHSPLLPVRAAQKSSSSTEPLHRSGPVRSSVASSSAVSPSSSAQLPRPHTASLPMPRTVGALSPTTKKAPSSSSAAGPSNTTHPRWSSNRVTDPIRPLTAPSSISYQTNLRSLPSLASITDDLSEIRSTGMRPGHYPASHPNTLSPIRADPRRDSVKSSTTEYSQAPTDYSFFGHRTSGSRPLSSGSTAYSSRMTDSRPQSATVPSPSGWGPSHAPSAVFVDHPIAESSAAAASRASRPSSGYNAPRGSLSSIDEQIASSAQPEDKAKPPTSSTIAGETKDSSEGSDDASSESGSQAGSYSRVLVGLLAETCHKLTGMDGTTGLYFFPKTLGVRTEGKFAIKCTLVTFEAPSPNGTNRSAVLSQVMTDPFEVFPAKRFPGVCPLTDMTRHFSRQGIRLPVRRKFRNAGYEMEDDGNDDEGQELYIEEETTQGQYQ